MPDEKVVTIVREICIKCQKDICEECSGKCEDDNPCLCERRHIRTKKKKAASDPA